MAAKSNKMGAISHGFEFSRTLSCAKATNKNSHKEAQKAHNVYSGRGALCFLPILWARLLIIILCFLCFFVAIYFVPFVAIVTLSVPMLPLVSKVRSEMVCSPGPRAPKSTV